MPPFTNCVNPYQILVQMDSIVYILPVAGVLALLFTFIRSNWVSKQEVGDEKMAGIAKNIADGAMAFLKAEYRVLAIFVAAVAVLLFMVHRF